MQVRLLLLYPLMFGALVVAGDPPSWLVIVLVAALVVSVLNIAALTRRIRRSTPAA